ncbi:DEAD-box ATP-dependent RNA helicase 42-like [Varroa jacobsoni]|uniref:DEAD-box ATP-dependent RNA helicase 42-like n=1 Tax=Varroa jacobsoni TaxID=62625 RepID=UPI000BF713BA|nr:DEAD-box ATP-dependent RNA helicase 42-like [Varroa jacobsoni]XP_022706223.1 DEAD-box ATP-dependent RNA helicase 42-like [Varroa jacobsoni]XP_022706224.1 DEAD-box ATP-dependent RNA helicase 42-like [Varroa jacobsoni]
MQFRQYFIVVCLIAAPCCAHLDARVRQESLWTGFSPTLGPDIRKGGTYTRDIDWNRCEKLQNNNSPTRVQNCGYVSHHSVMATPWKRMEFANDRREVCFETRMKHLNRDNDQKENQDRIDTRAREESFWSDSRMERSERDDAPADARQIRDNDRRENQERLDYRAYKKSFRSDPLVERVGREDSHSDMKRVQENNRRENQEHFGTRAREQSLRIDSRMEHLERDNTRADAKRVRDIDHRENEERFDSRKERFRSDFRMKRVILENDRRGRQERFDTRADKKNFRFNSRIERLEREDIRADARWARENDRRENHERFGIRVREESIHSDPSMERSILENYRRENKASFDTRTFEKDLRFGSRIERLEREDTLADAKWVRKNDHKNDRERLDTRTHEDSFRFDSRITPENNRREDKQRLDTQAREENLRFDARMERLQREDTRADTSRFRNDDHRKNQGGLDTRDRKKGLEIRSVKTQDQASSIKNLAGYQDDAKVRSAFDIVLATYGDDVSKTYTEMEFDTEDNVQETLAKGTTIGQSLLDTVLNAALMAAVYHFKPIQFHSKDIFGKVY